MLELFGITRLQLNKSRYLNFFLLIFKKPFSSVIDISYFCTDTIFFSIKFFVNYGLSDLYDWFRQTYAIKNCFKLNMPSILVYYSRGDFIIKVKV